MATQLNTGNNFAEDMVSVNFDQMVAASLQLRDTAAHLTGLKNALVSELARTDTMDGPAAVAVNTSKNSLFAAIQSTVNTLHSWSDIVENGAAMQKTQEANREVALTIRNAPSTLMA